MSRRQLPGGGGATRQRLGELSCRAGLSLGPARRGANRSALAEPAFDRMVGAAFDAPATALAPRQHTVACTAGADDRCTTPGARARSWPSARACGDGVELHVRPPRHVLSVALQLRDRGETATRLCPLWAGTRSPARIERNSLHLSGGRAALREHGRVLRRWFDAPDRSDRTRDLPRRRARTCDRRGPAWPAGGAWRHRPIGISIAGADRRTRDVVDLPRCARERHRTS